LKIIFYLAGDRALDHWIRLIYNPANNLYHRFLRGSRSATFGTFKVVAKEAGRTASDAFQRQATTRAIFYDLKQNI